MKFLSYIFSKILSGIFSKDNFFFGFSIIMGIVFGEYYLKNIIPLWGFLIIIILICLLFFSIKEIHALFSKKTNLEEKFKKQKDKNNTPPKITSARLEGEKLLLIAEASEFIERSSFVQIYFVDSFENHIGHGEVMHIQDDGLIQIEIKQINCEKSIYQKIVENNIDIIKKINYSPYINYKFLEEVSRWM